MLQVSPESNLDFRRPFNQVVRQTITLTNTASDGTLLAFKIKTTAPKQYCVRPNAGTIPAGASREVEVLLQAMKEDPAPDFKCKDKFLVQSIA
ncbi:phosphatidylinositol-binding protein scs2, partial [Chytriomyces hyalinus]